MKKKRLFSTLLVLSIFCTCYSQRKVGDLIDSLAQSNSYHNKVRLSTEIAGKLADSDWDRSLFYMETAKKFADKSGSPKLMADCNNAIAEIYMSKDAWDISLEHFLKAYQYYKDRPLKERYRLENDLGILYAETLNYDKALEFFTKIYNYDKTKETPLNLASAANNIGRVWLNKDLDSAIVYFKRALNLIEDIEGPGLKIYLYTNLGKIHTLKDEDSIAKHFFNLAFATPTSDRQEGDRAWAYRELGELYFKNKEIDSAIYYAKRAESILDSAEPFGFEHKYAVELLYKSLIEKEQYKDAVTYFEKFLNISDSLNLEEKRINVEKILLAEEYQTLDEIRELKISESRTRFYNVIISLVALLILLGVILYRYRARLKRTKLERQLANYELKELATNLDLKNKELVSKAMIEMHRTQIIEDISQELKKVKMKAEKAETKRAIDYLAARLKSSASSNIWEEFEVSFEAVHDSFFKNLTAAYPDLTVRERRLCALLKLNLTSKEIAELTGQTLKSVENARTRLRRKMEMTNSQVELSTHLAAFENQDIR